MVNTDAGPGFKILAREDFSDVTYSLVVHHPLMAQAAQPGQFVIVMSHESGERVPLTIADFDRKRGTVSLVVQAVGKSTKEMQQICKPGTYLYGLVGPMANRLKAVVDEEASFYRIIQSVLVAHLHGNAAQISVEIGRGNVPSGAQPSFLELEEALSAIPNEG